MAKKKSASIQLARGVYVRARRGWYHARFYDPKRRPKEKSVALNTQDLGLAVERGREHLRRYHLGTFDPWTDEANPVRLSQAEQRWESERRGEIRDVSIRDILNITSMLRRRAGDVLLAELRPATLRAFIYQGHLSLSTRRSYWRKLNTFFRWCVRAGLCEANPLEGLDRPPEPKARPKYYTEAEVDRLLTAVEASHEASKKYIHRRLPNPFWCRDVFEVAFLFGLRKSELARATWGDVVWPEGDRPGLLIVQAKGGKLTKSGEDGVVTMIPRALRCLRRIEAETRISTDPDEPLLKNATFGRIDPDYTGRRTRHYCEKAGLPSYGLHGLRHSFAALHRMHGQELLGVKDEMRHRDIKTTMKYAQIGVQQRARMTYELFEK